MKVPPVINNRRVKFTCELLYLFTVLDLVDEDLGRLKAWDEVLVNYQRGVSGGKNEDGDDVSHVTESDARDHDAERSFGEGSEKRACSF